MRKLRGQYSNIFERPHVQVEFSTPSRELFGARYLEHSGQKGLGAELNHGALLLLKKN